MTTYSTGDWWFNNTFAFNRWNFIEVFKGALTSKLGQFRWIVTKLYFFVQRKAFFTIDQFLDFSLWLLEDYFPLPQQISSWVKKILFSKAKSSLQQQPTLHYTLLYYLTTISEGSKKEWNFARNFVQALFTLILIRKDIKRNRIKSYLRKKFSKLFFI